MATTAGIAATSDGIRGLLWRAAAGHPDLTSLAVEHYQSAGLQAPNPGDGRLILSIWLHRVTVAQGRRHFPARTTPTGERLRPPLPVDLHYLVTAWAASAPMQHWLLGWAMRVIEDQPSLPASLLNDGRWAGVFQPEETVEVVWAPLTEQEESNLWQVAQTNRQPSASYVARMVGLESRAVIEEFPDVQTRDLEMAIQEGP